MMRAYLTTLGVLVVNVPSVLTVLVLTLVSETVLVCFLVRIVTALVDYTVASLAYWVVSFS